MAKLSTKILKDNITQWLMADKVLGWDSEYDGRSYKQYIEEFYSGRDELPFKGTAWDYFSNGNNWIREAKEKCEDGDQDCGIDEAGFESPKLATCNIEKCLKRIFTPRNLYDNHRIEIITDETDSEVLMWSIIVD
jgi:hypothetical protein